MADINFYKVTALPANPTPNSVYAVKGTIAATITELYITDINGNPKPIINKVQDINSPNQVDVPTTQAVFDAVEWQTTDQFFDL